MSDEWMGSTQAAARLGITPRTLYRLIDHGDLHAHRVGRLIRIRSDEIDRYLEQATIQPGTLSHLHTAASARPNRQTETP